MLDNYIWLCMKPAFIILVYYSKYILINSRIKQCMVFHLQMLVRLMLASVTITMLWDCFKQSFSYLISHALSAIVTIQSLIKAPLNAKTWMFRFSSCNCLCTVYWCKALSWEWRYSWSSIERRFSNDIWENTIDMVYQRAENMHKRHTV